MIGKRVLTIYGAGEVLGVGRERDHLSPVGGKRHRGKAYFLVKLDGGPVKTLWAEDVTPEPVTDAD